MKYSQIHLDAAEYFRKHPEDLWPSELHRYKILLANGLVGSVWAGEDLAEWTHTHPNGATPDSIEEDLS